MNDTDAKERDGERPHAVGRGGAVLEFRTADAWSFVYVFFSNGTPFDAPNRSETCPRS